MSIPYQHFRQIKSRCSVGNCLGLTLVEILLALALFGVTAGSLFALLTFLHAQSITTRDLTTVTEMMRTQVEQALVLPYDIDTNLTDTVDTRVTPEILRIAGDEPSTVGTQNPNTFVYNYGDEIGRQTWTPSFRNYDFALSATTCFNNVPLYVPADAARTNADLSGEKEPLRAPMVRGQVRFHTILLDTVGGTSSAQMAQRSLKINNETGNAGLSSNTGLRIFQVWVDPDSRGVGGNGLPAYRMVTFRAPDQ